jgi:SAM-dependent methyltransferase
MEHVRLADLAMHFTDGPTLLVRSQAHGVAARVPPPAVAVLALCGRPTTRAQVEAQLGPQLAGLYDGLVGAGLLAAPDKAADTPTFFHNFAGIEIHRRMLGDASRVDAYARAIAAAVRPGMAVLDAGTGSGLLASLAAKAGARVVYAVDNSEVLALAEATIAHNGLAGIVRPIRGDFGAVALPEKVDLIVSETFGALALAEGSVPDLLACAARNLAPGGRVLPDGVALRFAPVREPSVHAETLDPFGAIHGVDLAPLRAAALHRGRVVDVPANALLAPAATLAALPYPSASSPRGALTFEVPEGPITGLCGWFDVLDQGSVMLGTGPDAPPQHWRQTYLPLELDAPPGGGDLEIALSIEPAPDDRRSIEVRASWRLAGATGHRAWRVR